MFLKSFALGFSALLCVVTAQSSLAAPTTPVFDFTSFSSAVYATDHSVVVLEANGDGLPDLAAASAYGTTNIAVLTNNARGSFVLARFIATPSAPTYLFAAELNGDGLSDLVGSRNMNDGLTILTNNGSGNYLPASSIPTNGLQRSLTAADFNGDGLIDLAGPNVFTGQIQVFTNAGGANFHFATGLYSWFYPVLSLAADINGDNAPDLLSGNFEGAPLLAFTNNGVGTFTEIAAPQVPFALGQVIAADMNADGAADLVVSARSNEVIPSLAILTNNGTGIFSVASRPDAGPYVTALAAADFNQDGWNDLAVGAGFFNPTRLTVFTNDGTGNMVLLMAMQPLWQASAVMATDVNRDTRPDLLVPSYSATNVFVGLNYPPPSLEIRRTPTNSVVLSWPERPAFNLYRTTALPATNAADWTFTEGWTAWNGRREFVDPSPAATRIYRLRR